MVEHPDVWGDTVFSVVKVGNGTFGVHVLTGVHFPVLEGAEDLLDSGLGALLEGIDLGLVAVFFELLEGSLREKRVLKREDKRVKTQSERALF